MEKMENLYVCIATVKDDQLNGKHTLQPNKIF